MSDEKSLERQMANTKISEQELIGIDKIVFRNRHITANAIKQRQNLRVSSRTVQKYLNILGWRKVRTKYCQVVSPKNRIERFFFAKVILEFEDQFLDSIFIDESTVQMNKNASTIWYKVISGETRLGLIGKYKHAASVHILGGISRKGPTSLVIFQGTLDSKKFQRLAHQFLVPFIRSNYPEHHRLHMDNAPAHTAIKTRVFINENNINHYKTPAQSPDLMPIELVWHDLKVYLSEAVKPNNTEEMIDGIEKFWKDIVTVEYCNTKINHLNRVMKTIISLNGLPTGM